MAEVHPRVIALHEAAHAVVAVAFGIRIYAAHMCPPKTYFRFTEADRLGRVKAGQEPVGVRDAFVCQALAGLAAETAFLDIPIEDATAGATTDLIHVKHMLGTMPSAEVVNSAVETVKRYRKEISMVADALLAGSRVEEAVIAEVLGLSALDEDVD